MITPEPIPLGLEIRTVGASNSSYSLWYGFQSAGNGLMTGKLIPVLAESLARNPKTQETITKQIPIATIPKTCNS
jgi:F0F1-type ATP synthase membrane subunit c/vacuolar-type H+-ATPase subunit K